MAAGQIYGSKFSVSHRNGKPLKGVVIRHADILAGGTLEFEMTDRSGR